MNGFQKTCNVFGIIFAWILSFVFVAVLIVSPLVLTTLSVVEPSKAGDMLQQMNVADLVAPESDDPNMNAAMEDLLASDAAKKVTELYVQDIYNAMSGEVQEKNLTPEMLRQIAEEHMDELVKIVQDNDLLPEYSAEEIRDEILTLADDYAEEVLAMLPDVQQVKEEVVGDSAELKIVFRILAKKDMIAAVIVALTVVLAALIFVCRLPGFRGFRWLATDLYVGGGFLLVQCLAVVVGAGFVLQNLSSASPAVSLVIPVVTSLRNGLLIRTAIVLAVAVLFTVIYVLIKKARKKKQTQAELAAGCPGAED